MATLSRRIGVAVFVAASGAALLAQAQPQPMFRAQSALVAVYATVTDRNGQPVRGLTKEDFEVRDGGTVRDIVTFSSDQQPITLTMLLDRSGSVAKQAPEITRAAIAFFDALAPDDRVALGSLTWDCVPMTDDHARLKALAQARMPSDVGSPIWESIDRAFFSMAAEPGRRAILILSDGQDAGTLGTPMGSLLDFAGGNQKDCRPVRQATGSTREEVARRAERNGVLVYAVGIETSAGRQDGPLRSLARQTGGDLFRLRDGQSLADVFTDIVDELHQQYLIGFVPVAQDGRSRSIDVRVKRSGMSVRARRSYAMEPPPAAASDVTVTPVPPLTDQDIDAALADGHEGRSQRVACLTPIRQDGTYFEVTVEGPRARIARAAREARQRGERLTREDLSARHTAPTVHISAAGVVQPKADDPPGWNRTETTTERPAAPVISPPRAMSVRVRSAGNRPRVLDRIDARNLEYFPRPSESVFDLATFRAYGAPLEVLVTSFPADARCRLSERDLEKVR